MAGIMLHASSGSITLTANTAKTMLQINPAAHDRVKVSSWGVAFQGTSATDAPVLIELVRQSNHGSLTLAGAGVAIFKKNDGDPEVVQTAAYLNANVAVAEPNQISILERFFVHPQAGAIKIYPFGQELMVSGDSASAALLGIRVTPGNIAYATVCEFDFEE